MPDLPAGVQKVINARADDALRGLYESVKLGNRSGVEFWARELVSVLEDEQAAQREWSEA